MRRLLNIALAAGVTALAMRLIRRLLARAVEQDVQPAPTANSAVTREQLYRQAADLRIKGRSKMNKRQLREAVEAARSGGNS